MSIKKFSVTLLAGVMLLSGCSRQELPNEIPVNSSSTSEISDPMNEPVDTEPEIVPSTAYGFQFGKDDVSFSQDGLVLSPQITCRSSATNIGFSVFIDGIRQMYSIDNSTEKGYLTPVAIEANSEKTYELKVDGILDGELDNHYISFVTMLAPEFVPPTDAPTFGNYHSILSLYPVIADKEIENVLPSETHKILKAENSVFTQKQIEKYKIIRNSDDDVIENVYLLQGDNRLEDRYVMSENENSLKLHFAAFTTDTRIETQRVTFFVNHEPVKFNGDYEYLDYTMEGEKITEMDIEIENVKVGDFVYCISIPLSENGIEHKCSSKMIVPSDDSSSNSQNTNSSDNSQNSDTASSPQNSDIDNTSSSSNSDSGNYENPEQQISNGDVRSINFNGRIIPQFSIDNYIYATESSQKGVLLKLDQNGNVVKKLSNGANSKVHNDKIASTAENGDKVTLSLLDKDFNTLKSINIANDGASYGYDFDENRIVYVYLNDENSTELRTCDWNFANTKTLMSLPGGNIFGEIALADEFVAFKLTNKDGSYYGVCDFNGKSEKHPKTSMSNNVQRNGNTVLWSDKRGESTSSGELVLFRNGKFETVKTESSFESQDVFLTGENEFFTTLASKNILRQYKNSIKRAELKLENGESVISVVRVGNKVVAGIMTDNEYKLKIWELS